MVEVQAERHRKPLSYSTTHSLFHPPDLLTYINGPCGLMAKALVFGCEITKDCAFESHHGRSFFCILVLVGNETNLTRNYNSWMRNH
jgi:hypothetical protein